MVMVAVVAIMDDRVASVRIIININMLDPMVEGMYTHMDMATLMVD